MPESDAKSGGCFSVVLFIGILFLGHLSFLGAANRGTIRQFLYIGSEPLKHASIGWEKRRMYPLEDPFHGVRLAPGTTLELLGGTGSTFTVTLADGSPFTFEREFWVPGWGVPFKTVDYEVMNVPWDPQRSQPLCVSDRANPVYSYLL